MACTQYLGFSDLPTIYNVTDSVGPNMRNARDDVLLIQTLLKLANFTSKNDDRGLVEVSSNITVDGWFGEQTKRVIEAFEACVREEHLLLATDSVFEPSSKDGYTPQGVIYKIIHLNRFARQASVGSRYDDISIDSRTHPLLRQSLLGHGIPDLSGLSLKESNSFTWSDNLRGDPRFDKLKRQVGIK